MRLSAGILALVLTILISGCYAFNYNSIVSQRRVIKGDISMKIFDWKKREAFKTLVIPDDYVPSVSNIFPIPGSRRKRKRICRGISAGQGKTGGRGMRGQNSRSGGGTRPGFEGGQTPLYRRIPKFRTQKRRKPIKYALVKIAMLNTVQEGSEVDISMLRESGVLTKQKLKIYKVVGREELTVNNLIVRAHAFTQSAKEAIEEKGGTCVVLSRTTNKPISLPVEVENQTVDLVPVDS